MLLLSIAHHPAENSRRIDMIHDALEKLSLQHSVTPGPSSTTKVKTSFFSLPGGKAQSTSLSCAHSPTHYNAELRNEIYRLLSEATVQGNWGTRQYLRFCPNDWQNPDCWSRSCRHNLGLTQTCRLSRKENLPIYIAHTRICITFRRLVQYADRVRWDEFVLPSGMVTIDQGRYPAPDIWTRPSVNVVNLLRGLWYTKSPKPTFQNYHFQIFFDRDRIRLWEACLNAKIARVWVWPGPMGGAGGVIHLDVRADHVEKDTLWPRKRKHSLQRTWLQREGLGGLCGWPGLRICIVHRELPSPQMTERRYVSYAKLMEHGG